MTLKQLQIAFWSVIVASLLCIVVGVTGLILQHKERGLQWHQEAQEIRYAGKVAKSLKILT